MPTLNSYVDDMMDHSVFRVHEHPCLFLTCERWEHYHRPTDTPDKLNYEKVAAIAEYVCGLTARVCEAGLKGPSEGYDSTETELEQIPSNYSFWFAWKDWHPSTQLFLSDDTPL